ncbi:UBP3 hydrolase, partial [Polypterus senegalus]
MAFNPDDCEDEEDPVEDASVRELWATIAGRSSGIPAELNFHHRLGPEMPEGPELHLASQFVNHFCAGVVFSGKVKKSDVSKNVEVPFACDSYSITACSRGKEVRLRLTPIKDEESKEMKPTDASQPMDIIFRFGMSGFFRFTSENEIPKHSHLLFYTKEKPRRVLSFVDIRRFGSWEPNGSWQADRGPCVMFEYPEFRSNVLANLSDKAFDKPICEVLLNQKYFNGIGNYLRAEILYRVKIPPFVKARTVLDNLLPKSKANVEVKAEDNQCQTPEITLSKKIKQKKERPDILDLCHFVPLEVVKMGLKSRRKKTNKQNVEDSDEKPIVEKEEKKPKRKKGKDTEREKDEVSEEYESEKLHTDKKRTELENEEAAAAVKKVCNLPADEGQGSGNIPNLYYDKARDNCQPLSYRGSGGNLNRFSNDKMCMRNCSSKAHVLYPETDAVCKMKNDKGFCQGFYYVFHYDWSKRTCDGFFYTGCGGNGNRFETKEMCNRTCGHLVACNMNLDEGYGDGYFFRVYYNKTLDNCQPFSYRGSGGNLNKFITDKMCMRNCSSKGYEVYPESGLVFGIILILVGVAVFITVVVLAVKASKYVNGHAKKHFEDSQNPPNLRKLEKQEKEKQEHVVCMDCSSYSTYWCDDFVVNDTKMGLVQKVREHLQNLEKNGTSTVVTAIFGGVLQNEVNCLICGTESRKFDPFLGKRGHFKSHASLHLLTHLSMCTHVVSCVSDLSLDIPSQFRNKRTKNQENGPVCTLRDCLRSFTDLEELDETELYMCHKCKKRQKSTKKFWIQKLPKVLCLHLKRFHWTAYLRNKVDTYVEFPLRDLNMKCFLLEPENIGPESCLYDLAAVVVHHGSGVGSGHYTAYAAHEGRWFHFNDSTVTLTDEDTVVKAKAYILFYVERQTKSGSDAKL